MNETQWCISSFSFIIFFTSSPSFSCISGVINL